MTIEMKNALKVVAIILFATAGNTAYATPQEAAIDVVDTKYRNLFVFKVSPAFKGAEVEVYYSNGDLVTVQKLAKRKMIIDFCDARLGSYIIKVRSGNEVLDFQYVKK